MIMLKKLLHGSRHLADMIVNKDSDMMYAGVVSGNNTGEIWVDDISNPAFCVVWSEHLGGFHFMGSRHPKISKPELAAFVENTLIPFLKDKELSYCEFSCDSQEWAPFVVDALSKYKVDKSKQFVYKLHDKNSIDKNVSCPIGYDIFKLNESFVYDKLMSLENSEVIIDDIKKTWESLDKFIKLGKGYAAIQSSRICSFAITRFLYTDIYSIGTETLDPHKQKGLSGFLSMSLINDIANQGANIWWDCMEDNIASQKTAVKIGLAFEHEYEIFWFNIS